MEYTGAQKMGGVPMAKAPIQGPLEELDAMLSQLESTIDLLATRTEPIRTNPVSEVDTFSDPGPMHAIRERTYRLQRLVAALDYIATTIDL